MDCTSDREVLLLNQTIKIARRSRTIGGTGFPPSLVRWNPIAPTITKANIDAA
jgi:hypothetical protein